MIWVQTATSRELVSTLAPSIEILALVLCRSFVWVLLKIELLQARRTVKRSWAGSSKEANRTPRNLFRTKTNKSTDGPDGNPMRTGATLTLVGDLLQDQLLAAILISVISRHPA